MTFIDASSATATVSRDLTPDPDVGVGLHLEDDSGNSAILWAESYDRLQLRLADLSDLVDDARVFGLRITKKAKKKSLKVKINKRGVLVVKRPDGTKFASGNRDVIEAFELLNARSISPTPR